MTAVAAWLLISWLSGFQDAPIYEETRQDWHWGELLYGRTYAGYLTIANECAAPQRIAIFTDAPSLIIQRTATLPAKGSLRVPYRIMPIEPGTREPEPVHGEVAIWHPWDAASRCAPFRLVHVVTGTFRQATAADAQREVRAAGEAAVAAACAVWWLRGENPTAALSSAAVADVVRRALTTVDARRCAALARPRAHALLQRIGREQASRAPDSWRWLPDAAAIDRMSMSELASFRQRAVALMTKR